MLFTTSNFIFFIIILTVLYYLIPKKLQWVLLLIGSLIFYGIAGTSYLIYISLTVVSTYLVTIKIDKIQEIYDANIKENKEKLSREERKAIKAEANGKKRFWLVLALLFNFGILAVLKYSDFAVSNIYKDFGGFGFVLPLGISFYTFQTMGYLIDVYWGKYRAEKNVFKLGLFTSFFPQLIQGPISRFDDLKSTLFAEKDFNWDNFEFGVQRILWGYFKKLVIADRLLIAVNTIIRDPGTYQGAYVLLGMFFYAIQLYADFTGGIDIAIGVGQVLGIKLKENFNRPYFSKSIVEYWRRWHITLGTWFRDYMFFPISVSKPMINLSKYLRKNVNNELGKRVPIYIATLLVWLTTGIWHGAAWNFVVWGLGNGIVILISQELSPLYDKFHNKFDVKDKFYFKVFQIVRTFWLMSFLRTFDCYRDVGTTFKMYYSIFTVRNLNEIFSGGLMKLGLAIEDYILLTAGVVLLLLVSLYQRSGGIRIRLSKKPIFLNYILFFVLFLSIIIFGTYGIGFDQSQFIYSQF